MYLRVEIDSGSLILLKIKKHGLYDRNRNTRYKVKGTPGILL